MLTLDALFAPHGANSFFTEVLGKSALHLPGEAGKFTHLISWRDLNRLLEFGGLSFPRLRVVKGGQELPGDLYCGPGRSGYPRPLVRELTSLLRDGSVLAIQCIDELHEPTAALCQALEGGLGLPVQADLFADCHDAPVAPGRWSEQDVIVVQIEGRREWTLYSPVLGVSGETTDPTGEPAWRGLLSAQDLLYVPRGWWCWNEPVSDQALCLGLRFKNPTGLDTVVGLTQRLAAFPIMGSNIPLFGGPEAQASFLSNIQRMLTMACTEPGLILGCSADLRRLCGAP
jgi:Cupin superfamily protein